MIELSSKYPDEMSKFERDKLKSLLTEHRAIVPKLIERLNPPLTWISVFQDWEIQIRQNGELLGLPRKFDDPRAVHDIVGIIDKLLPELGCSLKMQLRILTTKVVN